MDPATRHFLKAVLGGTLAGGGLLLIVTIPTSILAFVDGEVAVATLVLVLPPLISGAGTFAGMILVGLPLTTILKKLGCEKMRIYSLVGSLAGFVLPGAFLTIVDPDPAAFIPAGLFLGMFGSIGGLAAASIWGAALERPPAQSRKGEIDSRKWLL